MHKLMVVGLGPGHPDYILPIAKHTVDTADIVIGGSRHIESLELGKQEIFRSDGRLTELPNYIRRHIECKKIAVVVSGDTGFYSLLRYLKKQLDDIEIEAVPGISSMQYLFSKLGLAWDDAYLGSMHGRDLDLPVLCEKHAKVGLLTDQKHTPVDIANLLLNKSMKGKKMVVGERLSYDDECIRAMDLEYVHQQSFDELNVVIILSEEVQL